MQPNTVESLEGFQWTTAGVDIVRLEGWEKIKPISLSCIFNCDNFKSDCEGKDGNDEDSKDDDEVDEKNDFRLLDSDGEDNNGSGGDEK